MCCYPFEEILGYGFVWTFEGLDEDYSVIGVRLFGVDALDAERHCGSVARSSRLKG